MVLNSVQLLENPSGALVIPELDAVMVQPCYFSLVIPTFNESRNIGAMLQRLVALLDEAYADRYEIIVVDDDSPDRTWEVALGAAEQLPRVRVIRRQTERGLATAVIRGWQAAGGEVIGVIDGDLQHPPEVLLQLLGEIDAGADFVIASRHVEGGGISEWGFVRRLLSRGAQLLGLVIAPTVVGRVSDPMSGYFMLRRRALAGVELNPKGYKISLEALGRGRIDRIAEVGYVFQERQAGESKVTARQYVDYIHHLLKLRSRGRVSRMRNQIPFPIGRFLRFGFVGLSGVVVDMAVLYLLHSAASPLGLAWGLTRSKIIASEVAILNNFCWNDRWTFKDLAGQQKSVGQWVKRFVKFNLICLLGLTLNVLILNLLFNLFGINAYVANLLAIVIVTFWNFWINLKLNWRVTSSK
ncbi:glycosyltransferase [filamentous cyanobacterium LEGE 11480]|uniref:Dolichol-phosphate mannosyltransferase n=1 Tax=Romeriopsis navalis LEGE 11480 TaxID=2777977 RepID=A0A928VM70_9CYAN|nr:glycosyltransferase [Romeriopsis navalis]MBE9030885.1 glycosyltransferase [Romeriopsis navalis LEGE 11480]